MRKETTKITLIRKHVVSESRERKQARKRASKQNREKHRNDAWPKIAIVKFTNTQYYKICGFEM